MSDNTKYDLTLNEQVEANTILFTESGAFIKVSSDGVATVSDHFSTEDAAKLLGCISDAWNRQQSEIARLRDLVERAYREGHADAGSRGIDRELDWMASKSRDALEQRPSPDLPSDVVRLIIAARTMALGDWYSESEGYEVARKELDDAAEAFASRVEWPDTPSEKEGGE